jgi:hypothetical protein
MKTDLHNLTLEELILLMEAADDRLQNNPLDAKALSDYNLYYNLIQRLENA